MALNLYKAVKPSGLVIQIELKCLLMKPTHDDIIEAKKIYIQLSFERYKGKLVLRILSPSVNMLSFFKAAISFWRL